MYCFYGERDKDTNVYLDSDRFANIAMLDVNRSCIVNFNTTEYAVRSYSFYWKLTHDWRSKSHRSTSANHTASSDCQ